MIEKAPASCENVDGFAGQIVLNAARVIVEGSPDKAVKPANVRKTDFTWRREQRRLVK